MAQRRFDSTAQAVSVPLKAKMIVRPLRKGQEYPSSITVNVIAEGEEEAIGYLIPRPTECGDQFVRDMCRQLGIEVSQAWQDLVEQYAARRYEPGE